MTENPVSEEIRETDLPSAEERKWAAYAHQTIFWMWLVYLWFGAMVASTLLLEMFKTKSRYVAFHARQTLYLQLVIVAFIGPGWIVSKFTKFSSLDRIVQILLGGWTIAGIIVAIAGMAASLSATQRTRQGADFEYWLIGRWARARDRTTSATQ